MEMGEFVNAYEKDRAEEWRNSGSVSLWYAGCSCGGEETHRFNKRRRRKRRRLSLFVIRSQMRVRPTRIMRNTDPNHGCDECVASVHA